MDQPAAPMFWCGQTQQQWADFRFYPPILFRYRPQQVQIKAITIVLSSSIDLHWSNFPDLLTAERKVLCVGGGSQQTIRAQIICASFVLHPDGNEEDVAASLLLAEPTLAERSRSCTANLTDHEEQPGSDPPHTPEDSSPDSGCARADGMELFSKLLQHLAEYLLNIHPIWIGFNSKYTHMSINRD